MPSHQQTLTKFFGGSIRGNSASKKSEEGESITSTENDGVERSRSRSRSGGRGRSRSGSDHSSELRAAKKAKTGISGKETLAEEVVDSTSSEREAIPESKSVLVDDDIENHRVKNELHDAEDLLRIDNEVHRARNPSKIIANKPIPYAALCDVFEKLEEEAGRLKNLAIASEFFCDLLRKSSKGERKSDGEGPAAQNLIEVTYLMINRLGPDYEPDLELGLGETLLLKALGQSTGREMRHIRDDYHKLGDIGKVAQISRSRQPIMFKPKSLTIHQVFNNLTEIAKSTGNSSQSKKIGIINRMLAACEGQEAKFLMRSLEGKLRINFGEKSVLMALAKAFVEFEGGEQGDNDINAKALVIAQEQIKEAFSQTPNYEMIVRNSLKYGISHVAEHCTLKPGIPVKPMLAKPTKSISEIMDTLQGQTFTCEYKYDGERAQIHLMPNGDMRVYSRNSENMTERYPDLIPVVQELRAENPEIESLILDSECVAWDTEAHKILPFQVLSTRKRKDVQEKDIKVRVCLFVFDMLFYNGEPIIQKPLNERREFLYKHVKQIPQKLQFATKLDSTSTEEMSAFLDQSVHDSCEGLMIKSLYGSGSRYEPSKRSRNWLKLKKDYLEGVGDSLDLVVIGGYIGKGKRTGWYGGFLLASYNQDTGEYESVCKIGTGFSEELLANLREQLKPKEISQPKASYVYSRDNSNAEPDIWFEPYMVFEVKVADLTTSPIYKSGASYFGDGEKGISLRFPRFIQIRQDKSTEDATSSEQIVEMFESQAVMQ
ncbi:DEKNAAC104615 [Brettanomyces naardenensis]|uniref:DNA ligase n=1 Tax=Brettanomyces naardenensis TaxID=13370 RepID=A0A448YRA6_BRENA|nr:DEKNAAC104615 [Brettanomyces naardenensis]